MKCILIAFSQILQNLCDNIFIILILTLELFLNISFEMAWYGTTSTKQQIDNLLLKRPNLFELFSIVDLVQELKAYNSKLL